MRILSISAQKPDSTGSGIYMTELIKALSKMGHEQAAIAGISKNDSVSLPPEVEFFPVYFDTNKLPFHVVGMSDEMPYESTRYRDMDEDMTERFMRTFAETAGHAIEKFRPDIVLCHHLYLMTATIRHAFPDIRIYGFCHNTDLRQMTKTDLKRDFIAENIRKLDRIFVAQSDQKKKVVETYGVKPGLIEEIGTGYNSDLFYDRGLRRRDGVTRFVFVGKIAEKKGVKCLLKAMERLGSETQGLRELYLAGGAGDRKEYEEIRHLAEGCPVKTVFMGKLSQEELSELYCKCDIFVLPSYFDSIPLTVVEALACGCKVVVSELPGLRDWAEKNIKNADIRFVAMPEMKNADEPDKESLPDFERRIEEALLACEKDKVTRKADLSNISWRGIAARVCSGI
ncbi:MAG: glycosyltransferase family 4 protein [Candidatus Avilachnospira sp.]|jgi:glycosyltransferase involved in cell wall biosynthesis